MITTSSSSSDKSTASAAVAPVLLPGRLLPTALVAILLPGRLLPTAPVAAVAFASLQGGPAAVSVTPLQTARYFHVDSWGIIHPVSVEDSQPSLEIHRTP